MAGKDVELAESVMARTELRGGCVIYTGPKNQDGYGIVQSGRKQLLVHRVVWEAEHGKVSDDYVVHHACRSKTCVALEHLDAMSREDHTALHNTERAADNAAMRNWGMEAIGRLMRGD